MAGTQPAIKYGNKAALTSMVKEAEGKPKAATNIKKPTPSTGMQDNKAKAGQHVLAKRAVSRAKAGASGCGSTAGPSHSSLRPK